jgi:hypothetical protein
LKKILTLAEKLGVVNEGFTQSTLGIVGALDEGEMQDASMMNNKGGVNLDAAIESNKLKREEITNKKSYLEILNKSDKNVKLSGDDENINLTNTLGWNNS